MAKEIELSKGYRAIVDDEDFESLDQYYWYAKKDRVTVYACGTLSRKPSNVGEITAGRRRPKGHGSIGKMITLHRFLLNAPDGIEVDHINRNGLDNRRSNLRLASRSENLQNRRRFKNNKIGHKAIHFENKTGRYVVKISVSYDTLEEALRERDKIFRFVYGDRYNDGSIGVHLPLKKPNEVDQ
jgi:hypothetical protein